jgi:hypothetical protein
MVWAWPAAAKLAFEAMRVAVALEVISVELVRPLTDHGFGHPSILFRRPDGEPIEILAEI